MGEEEWADLRRALLRMTRRYGVRSADAEDIVQQVLERFITNGPFHAVDSHWAPGFLRQVCLNAVRSEYRSRVRRHTRESAWSPPADVALEPEWALIEKEKTARCLAAIANLSKELPEPAFRAFALCDIEGLCAPAVAQVLEVPEGTVRTWLRRARGQVAENFRTLEQRKTA